MAGSYGTIKWSVKIPLTADGAVLFSSYVPQGFMGFSSTDQFTITRESGAGTIANASITTTGFTAAAITESPVVTTVFVLHSFVEG